MERRGSGVSGVSGVRGLGVGSGGLQGWQPSELA